jgi:hypothetical protein
LFIAANLDIAFIQQAIFGNLMSLGIGALPDRPGIIVVMVFVRPVVLLMVNGKQGNRDLIVVVVRNNSMNQYNHIGKQQK